MRTYQSTHPFTRGFCIKFVVFSTSFTVFLYIIQNIDSILGYPHPEGRRQALGNQENVIFEKYVNISIVSPGSIAHDRAEHIDDQKHKFNRYRMAGVVIVHDLCIETDPKHGKVPVQKRLKIGSHLDLEKKILVAYNYRKNYTQIHKVGAHGNVRVRDWEVHYRTGAPPRGSHMIDSHTAYFMTTSCDGNLWLFFEDALRGLYTVIKNTNRLHSKEKNIVYYREPLWEYSQILDKFIQCWDPARFEGMLLSLNFR